MLTSPRNGEIVGTVALDGVTARVSRVGALLLAGLKSDVQVYAVLATGETPPKGTSSAYVARGPGLRCLYI
jgi:hypothetical protein